MSIRPIQLAEIVVVGHGSPAMLSRQITFLSGVTDIALPVLPNVIERKIPVIEPRFRMVAVRFTGTDYTAKGAAGHGATDRVRLG
jgi:hypothetical protein